MPVNPTLQAYWRATTMLTGWLSCWVSERKGGSEREEERKRSFFMWQVGCIHCMIKEATVIFLCSKQVFVKDLVPGAKMVHCVFHATYKYCSKIFLVPSSNVCEPKNVLLLVQNKDIRAQNAFSQWRTPPHLCRCKKCTWLKWPQVHGCCSFRVHGTSG